MDVTPGSGVTAASVRTATYKRFNCQQAEDAIFNRKRKFLTNYASLDDLICYVCQNFANA